MCQCVSVSVSVLVLVSASVSVAVSAFAFAYASTSASASASVCVAWLPALAERCCDVYGKHRCRFERDCPCINLPNRVDRLVFACGLVLTA